MNKKQTMALMAAGMIALFGLSGCTNEKGNSGNGIVSSANADDAKPENKIFEPGKHCFWRFYNPSEVSGQITIPNGYEILDVESTVSAGTSYMVWYINTETVEAEAVHNSFNGTYSYSKAGKVVKKNKTK